MIHLKKNIDRLNENLKKLIALSDTVVYQSHFSKKKFSLEVFMMGVNLMGILYIIQPIDLSLHHMVQL